MAHTEAKAVLPESTPEGFAKYLNNASWEGSSSYKVLNAYKCKWDHDYYDECRIDYEEVSPLGKKTCVNVLGRIWNKASKSPGGFRIYPGGIDNFFETEKPGECSDWEKVANTPPEPQTEPTPEPAPPPVQPAPKPTTPTNNPAFTPTQLAVSGGAIFLIGGIFGAVLGLSAGKKKSTWKDI